MFNISNSNKPSLVNLKSSNSLHFLFPQPYLPHDGGPTRFCALWGCNWRMLDVKKLLGNALLWPLISRLPQPNLSQGGATLPTVLFLVDVWDAENNGLWACLTIPPAISMKQYSITQIHFTSFRVLIERIAIVEKWRRTGHHIISISQLSFRNWDKSLMNASFEKLLNQNLKSRPELRLAIQGKLSLNYVSKLAFSFLLRLLTHK